MINPEDKITVNITLKLINKDVSGLENWLNNNYNLISFEHLQDTSKMYVEDKTFKKLVKDSSDLKKRRLDYIIKNNYKY